jgi:hypothetical protein
MHACIWFAWYVATHTYVHVHATHMLLHVRPEKRLIRDDSEGRK